MPPLLLNAEGVLASSQLFQEVSQLCTSKKRLNILTCRYPLLHLCIQYYRHHFRCICFYYSTYIMFSSQNFIPTFGFFNAFTSEHIQTPACISTEKNNNFMQNSFNAFHLNYVKTTCKSKLHVTRNYIKKVQWAERIGCSSLTDPYKERNRKTSGNVF